MHQVTLKSLKKAITEQESMKQFGERTVSDIIVSAAAHREKKNRATMKDCYFLMIRDCDPEIVRQVFSGWSYKDRKITHVIK